MNKKLLLILLLAFVLRIISLNQSLWLDEATSALVTQMTFSDYFNNFVPGDFHPPLYYLLLTMWSKIFGSSETALRSLSVLAGLGIVYLSYLIAKTVSSEKVGLLSALLAATSGLLIYYSQEARMYELAAFFVVLSIYLLLKTTQKGSALFSWVFFGAAVAASILTHYLTLFMIPAYWLWIIVKGSDRGVWKGFLLSWTIPALALFAWSPKFLEQFMAGRTVESTSPLWWNILGRTTLKEVGLVPTKFILGRISIENPLLYGLVVAGTGILFLYILWKAFGNITKVREKFASEQGLIWFWLLVPAGASALLGFWLPVFSYFRLLYVLPAMYILLAIGVSNLKKYSTLALLTLLIINIVSSGAYLLNPKFHREDWKSLIAYIEQNSEGKTILIFPANSQMEVVNYYSPDFTWAGPTGITDNHNTIWLLRYVQNIFDPEDTTRKTVEESYNKVSEHDFTKVVVWKYENRN